MYFWRFSILRKRLIFAKRKPLLPSNKLKRNVSSWQTILLGAQCPRICEAEFMRRRKNCVYIFCPSTAISYPKMYICVFYCRVHIHIDTSQCSSYSFMLAINVHVNFTLDWKYRMPHGMFTLRRETDILRSPNSIFIFIILCTMLISDARSCSAQFGVASSPTIANSNK